MSFFLWLKSNQKLRIGLALLILFPLVLSFMPAKYMERMDTITTYEQDESALGRINAWKMAFNLASDRPLVGGGYEIYEPAIFARYAPNPKDIHAAHSIYFQVLGEHGFVGLFIYLALAGLTWRYGNWIVRNTANHPELRWASDLATMLKVSLLGFAVGGAFLSLLYFDVPYYLVVAMVATKILVQKELKLLAPPARNRINGVMTASAAPARVPAMASRRAGS